MKLVRTLVLAGLSLGIGLLPARSSAFDVVDRRESFLDSKYITLGVGLGTTGFSQQMGVSGNTGFGFRVTAGHQFSRYLNAEILYQLSTFAWNTPDPVSPTTATLRTRAELNQEAIRLIALYPAVAAVPFVTVGFGGYALTGVSSATGLDFSQNFMIPFGAGVRTYLYENKISFDVEFNYQILFGLNQSADTLKILGLKEVSFNTYSLMATFGFHLF
ncbi:MAG: outer membrane beta-barrel protein [Pseudomonadota bacterium]